MRTEIATVPDPSQGEVEQVAHELPTLRRRGFTRPATLRRSPRQMTRAKKSS